MGICGLFIGAGSRHVLTKTAQRIPQGQGHRVLTGPDNREIPIPQVYPVYLGTSTAANGPIASSFGGTSGKNRLTVAQLSR